MNNISKVLQVNNKVYLKGLKSDSVRKWVYSAKMKDEVETLVNKVLPLKK